MQIVFGKYQRHFLKLGLVAGLLCFGVTTLARDTSKIVSPAKTGQVGKFKVGQLRPSQWALGVEASTRVERNMWEKFLENLQKNGENFEALTAKQKYEKYYKYFQSFLDNKKPTPGIAMKVNGQLKVMVTDSHHRSYATKLANERLAAFKKQCGASCANLDEVKMPVKILKDYTRGNFANWQPGQVIKDIRSTFGKLLFHQRDRATVQAAKTIQDWNKLFTKLPSSFDTIPDSPMRSLMGTLCFYMGIDADKLIDYSQFFMGEELMKRLPRNIKQKMIAVGNPPAYPEEVIRQVINFYANDPDSLKYLKTKMVPRPPGSKAHRAAILHLEDVLNTGKLKARLAEKGVVLGKAKTLSVRRVGPSTDQIGKTSAKQMEQAQFNRFRANLAKQGRDWSKMTPAQKHAEYMKFYQKYLNSDRIAIPAVRLPGGQKASPYRVSQGHHKTAAALEAMERAKKLCPSCKTKDLKVKLIVTHDYTKGKWTNARIVDDLAKNGVGIFGTPEYQRKIAAMKSAGSDTGKLLTGLPKTIGKMKDSSLESFTRNFLHLTGIDSRYFKSHAYQGFAKMLQAKYPVLTRYYMESKGPNAKNMLLNMIMQDAELVDGFVNRWALPGMTSQTADMFSPHRMSQAFVHNVNNASNVGDTFSHGHMQMWKALIKACGR